MWVYWEDKETERDGGCGDANWYDFSIAICEINRLYLQLINKKLKCILYIRIYSTQLLLLSALLLLLLQPHRKIMTLPRDKGLSSQKESETRRPMSAASRKPRIKPSEEPQQTVGGASASCEAHNPTATWAPPVSILAHISCLITPKTSQFLLVAGLPWAYAVSRTRGKNRLAPGL